MYLLMLFHTVDFIPPFEYSHSSHAAAAPERHLRPISPSPAIFAHTPIRLYEHHQRTRALRRHIRRSRHTRDGATTPPRLRRRHAIFAAFLPAYASPRRQPVFISSLTLALRTMPPPD
jgi:hypothetical protein